VVSLNAPPGETIELITAIERTPDAKGKVSEDVGCLAMFGKVEPGKEPVVLYPNGDIFRTECACYTHSGIVLVL
jgi:hypothetical protein